MHDVISKQKDKDDDSNKCRLYVNFSHEIWRGEMPFVREFFKFVVV